MATRGRRSAAALSVVPAVTEQRPAPPKELTPEQAKEWRVVVARLPADWFPRETHQLLIQYCRHVVRARELARDRSLELVSGQVVYRVRW